MSRTLSISQLAITHGPYYTIHRGFHGSPPDPVLVRTLDPQFSGPVYRRIQKDDYFTTSRLRHPNLLNVVAFECSPDGYPVLIYADPRGEPAHAVLSTLDDNERLETLLQLARAINYLHSRGRVLGAIQPDSVLIRRQLLGTDHLASSPALQVTLLEPGQTPEAWSQVPFRIPGRWASPELTRGLTPDYRSDLYSLGLLVLQIFGIRSYYDDQFRDHRIDLEKLPAGTLPPGAAHFLIRALSEHPSSRPDTVIELIETLNRYSSTSIPLETPEGFSAAISSVPMVARHAILKASVDSLTATYRGSHSSTTKPIATFLVHGEGGIGKSLLVEELQRILLIEDVPVLLARCIPDSHVPLQPFWPLLSEHTRLLHDTPLTDIPQTPQGSLPSLDAYVRQRQLDYCVRGLADLLAHDHSILIVEDLHNADEESFDVFLGLVEQAWIRGFTLFATFRNEGILAHRLQRLLRSELTSLHMQSWRLDRLDLDEVIDLLTSALGPHHHIVRIATYLFHKTRGNPLHIIEHLRHLQQKGQLAGAPFAWSFRPPSESSSAQAETLASQVSSRLANIPSTSRSLLEYLAAFGGTASLDWLHESTGLPYIELKQLLSELLPEGFVSVSLVENTFSISNEYYSRELYSSMSPPRRKGVHRSIGVAFERLGSTADIEVLSHLAHHFLRAGHSAKGSSYAQRAASAALRIGATRRAIDLYTECLDVLPSGDPDVRFEVLLGLARLLRQAGDHSRAESFYLEVLLIARRRADVKRESHALALLGYLHADRGDFRHARALATKAAQLSQGERTSSQYLEALLVLTRVAHHEGQFAESLKLANRTKALSSGSDDHLTFGFACNMAGLALTSLRRYEEAIDEFEVWLEVAEKLGDHYAKHVALANLGLVRLELGSLHEAEELFDRCFTVAGDRSLASTLSASALNSGEVYRYQGKFVRSRERYLLGLSAAESALRTELNQYAVYSLGLLSLEDGLIGEALPHLRAALLIAQQVGAQSSIGMTEVGLARSHMLIGQYPQAEEYIVSALSCGHSVGDPLLVSQAYTLRVETLALQRLSLLALPGLLMTDEAPPSDHRRQNYREECDSDELARSVAECALVGERTGTRVAILESRLAVALGTLALGGFQSAIDIAERAYADAADAGYRIHAARALLIKGVACLHAASLGQAEAALVKCMELSDCLGHVLLQAQVRYELSRLCEKNCEIKRSAILLSEAALHLERVTRTFPEASERHSFVSVPWRAYTLTRACSLSVPSAAFSLSSVHQQDGTNEESRQPTTARCFKSSDQGARSPIVDASIPTGESDDLRSFLTHTLQNLLRCVGTDRGMVFLLDAQRPPELVVARGVGTDSIDDARLFSRSFVGRASDGEDVLVVDTSRDPRLRESLKNAKNQAISVICVPLRLGSRVLGALYLDSRPGGRLLRERDLATAKDVAVRMAARIRDVWERERVQEEALLQQKSFCKTYRLDAIIGESPAMRKVFRVLEAVIASDCNVLIVGESGTGKELAARAIHFSGRRKMAPFVPIDSGALQDSLVESELFGYRRGAFTGADADKRGLFEEADGGTLFLDEITNTSIHFQAKLLRVLQSGEFRRIGDTSARKVDVRIVAATNANLEEIIRRGAFREDLYYRLNVVTVHLPPLRERKEDIPALAGQFASAFCSKEKVAYRGMGDSALGAMTSYSWPGNVRELRNAVESALIMSRDGAVRREFLPEPLRDGSFDEIRDLLQGGSAQFAREEEKRQPRPEPRESASPEGWVTPAERIDSEVQESRKRILDALRRAGGDKSLAARILGCSRMTLYRRMQRFDISYGSGRSEDNPAS